MNTRINKQQWQEEEALRRFQLISPLLQADLDDAKRIQLRKKIAEENHISVRSLYRYEKAFSERQFTGLKPADREKHRSQKLPENFEFLLEQAIQLRKEVPERSVAQIIYILETEGLAAPGALKRSTLERHIYKAALRPKADADVPGCKEQFFQTFLQTTPHDADPGGYQVWSQASDWKKWSQGTDLPVLGNR